MYGFLPHIRGNLSEVPSSVAQLNKQPVHFLHAVLRFHGHCPYTKDELVRFSALLLLSFFSSTRYSFFFILAEALEIKKRASSGRDCAYFLLKINSI